MCERESVCECVCEREGARLEEAGLALEASHGGVGESVCARERECLSECVCVSVCVCV